MELDEEDYELLGWGACRREEEVEAFIFRRKSYLREWQKKNKDYLNFYKRAWRAARRGPKPPKKVKPPKRVKGPPKTGAERQRAYLQRKKNKWGTKTYRKWRAKKQREWRAA